MPSGFSNVYEVPPRRPPAPEKSFKYYTASKLEVKKLNLDDANCKLESINLKQCPDRLDSLLSHVGKLQRPPDIIAIQDPPKKPKPSGSCGAYVLWCVATDGKEFTSEDNPSSFNYAAPYSRPKNSKEEPKTAARSPIKVAFLIHKSVMGYKIVPATGKNKGLMATLFLQHAAGTLAIHNFYNHQLSLDIEEFVSSCEDGRFAHVWVGDLNLHHYLWTGPKGPRPERDANLFVAQALAAGMTCLNNGDTTYSRGKQTEGKYTSVVDVTFVSDSIAAKSTHRIIPKVPGFESDHRISELIIEAKVDRRPRRRHVWRLTPRTEFNDMVEKGLKDIEPVPPKDESAVLQMLRDVISKGIAPAIAELVPVQTLYQLGPTPQRWKRSKNKSTRIRKFRKAMSVMSSGRRGVFHVAQRAVYWGMPKGVAHTPDLKLGSEVFSTDPEKTECIVTSIWNDTERKGPNTTRQAFPSDPLSGVVPSLSQAAPTHLDSSTPRSKFPLPDFDASRQQHLSPDVLDDGELVKLLKTLPDNKAHGVDGVPYEALKMCRQAIYPFLELIFNACFRLRIHPDHFKTTITIFIKKPGKDPQHPNSYRPIAILNTIAKVYERLIADRLKALSLKHHLLPNTQFGAPGRSTTLALEHCLNRIYHAWLGNQKASILALDLSGAYDRVNRKKLLETLMKKGIPDWLVQIIWAFLSDRRSFMHIPGYEGDEYWINVGIPQGSPLSPLLFLFYAAPLLEDMVGAENEYQITMYSYVDDTYVLVASYTFEKNRTLMTTLHKKLFDWAETSNMKFSPTKYRVMHFQKRGAWSKKSQCRLLPDLEEFKGLTSDQIDTILPESLVILGVAFDKSLTWESHIDKITRSVRKQLGSFKRFSGATWGPNLFQQRQLYHGKLLPTIAYAAPAWFTHVPNVPGLEKTGRINFGISKTALDKLRSLQIECVLALSGARKLTPYEVLQNEMHIIPLEYKLHEFAMNHRFQQHDSFEYSEMARLRSKPWGSLRGDLTYERKLINHPYHILRIYAGEGLSTLRYNQASRIGDTALSTQWELPEKRKAIIKEHNQLCSYFYASKAWAFYQRARYSTPWRVMNAAHTVEFGNHRFQYYIGLTRAQSTMAIMMRTGNIALRGNAVWRHVNKLKDTDNKCTRCGNHIETVEHLLCHCKELHAAREHLKLAVGGVLCFERLMTTDLELASAWAIRYFDLEQFKYEKKAERYQFPRTRTHKFWQAKTGDPVMPIPLGDT
jgi:hypothetical protein